MILQQTLTALRKEHQSLQMRMKKQEQLMKAEQEFQQNIFKNVPEIREMLADYESSCQ